MTSIYFSSLVETSNEVNSTLNEVVDLHLQTLLVEGVQNVGAQLAGQMYRVVAGQEIGSVHGQVIQDERADHGINCTGTELLQEGCA